jgi:hypothetical protein
MIPSTTALLSRAARSPLELPRSTKRLIMIGADATMLPIALALQFDWCGHCRD